MINFAEELLKFRPSTEVEGAENAILQTDTRDMTDLMLEILKEKEE